MYEKEGIKDIPTQRFAEIMGEEKVTHQSSIMLSFYSDDSFELLNDGPDLALLKPRPQIVPPLNLNNMPSYESEEDEDE